MCCLQSSRHTRRTVGLPTGRHPDGVPCDRIKPRKRTGPCSNGTRRVPTTLRFPMRTLVLVLALAAFALAPASAQQPKPAAVRVGAASAELEADDDMVIGGSILPYKVKGQEGK